MKVLLTGISSFTGSWFAKALAEAGHEVFGTLRGLRGGYDGVRSDRLVAVRAAGVHLLEATSFGDDRFLEALRDMDVVCHHGAEVRNYHSADFDTLAAVAANTTNVRTVMENCAAVGAVFIASGSVFEPGEGLGEAPLQAFSPYGLSKGLSWQVQDFWAGQNGVPIGKFVISNPFGPLEEARFCAYLMRTWAKGEVAYVRTPAYVRDNIPVDLLSVAYTAFVERMATQRQAAKCTPSGYVESQGRFAERFAQEIGTRLGLSTGLSLAQQTEFQEPLIRIGSGTSRFAWSETAFWNAAAEYYRQTYL